MAMTMATILAMTTIDQLQVKSHVSMKLPHMKIYIEFFFFFYLLFILQVDILTLFLVYVQPRDQYFT